MKSRLIFAAGLTALLSTTSLSLAQTPITNQTLSVADLDQRLTALSDRELRSLLQEIRRGTSPGAIMQRFDLTHAELQAIADRFGISIGQARSEANSILRDLRNRVSLQTILAKYGLTEEELRQLAVQYNFVDLYNRVVSAPTAKPADSMKPADKAARAADRSNRRGSAVDDETGSLQGASRFAPGQVKEPGESARAYAPGQEDRTGTARGASSFAPGQQDRTGSTPSVGTDVSSTGSIGGGQAGSNGRGNGGPQGGGPGNSGQADKSDSDNGGGKGNGSGGGNAGGNGNGNGGNKH